MDSIVIGSGFGGIAAALRLRAKSHNVTLIEKHKDLGVLAVTSSDILFHEWKNNKVSTTYNLQDSHIENLLKIIPKDCKMISVLDGHPMTLSWISGVFGHNLIPLGVNDFGQTGTSADLYEKYNIDSNSIIKSVNS